MKLIKTDAHVINMDHVAAIERHADGRLLVHLALRRGGQAGLASQGGLAGHEIFQFQPGPEADEVWRQATAED